MKNKHIIIALLVLLVSCNKLPNNKPFDSEHLTSLDSTIMHAIENKYTEQNELEGTEYATVEELNIKDIKYDFRDSTCFATYHIRVTYSPIALGPGYERDAPPPLIIDKTSQVIKTNGEWKMIQ